MGELIDLIKKNSDKIIIFALPSFLSLLLRKPIEIYIDKNIEKLADVDDNSLLFILHSTESVLKTVFVYIIILIVLCILEFFILSIINRRGFNFVITTYKSKFDDLKAELSEVKSNYYDGDNIKENYINRIYDIVGKCVSFLNKIIPHKINNKIWNNGTVKLINHLSYDSLNSFANDCENILNDLKNLDNEITQKTNNLQIEERLKMFFDHLHSYKRDL